MSRPRAKQAPAAIFEETELVQRVLAREAGAFRTILQRHNRRLYRIARAVLRDDTEAEDVVQEATYLLLLTFRVIEANRASAPGFLASR